MDADVDGCEYRVPKPFATVISNVVGRAWTLHKLLVGFVIVPDCLTSRSQRHYLYAVDGFYARIWWIRRLCWRDLGSAGATSFSMMAFAGWQQTVPAM